MPEQRVSILVYRPDGTLIAQYLLGDGEHLIGRDIHCPVYLDSEHISRNHAKLQLSHDGIQIEDLNSTAGTYLDGVAVRGKLRIKPGQRLQVGDLTVDLQLESEGQIGPGSRLGDGRYTLIRLLGRGGMGEVWLAKDEQLDEEVALKKLPPEVGADAMALADMRREVQKSRVLSHPNIIRIHDLFRKSGEDPLISLEFVDGTDLTAIAATKTNGIFGWEDIKGWTLQLVSAMEYAHEEKIVHRDLKPGNIMISRKGRLKLADFGIAATVADSLSRSSMQGFVSGTTLYMSPQQMEGAAPRETDDIYAFGATLYELLTSRAPFYTGNVEHQVLQVTPTPPSQRLAEFGFISEVPPHVNELVMACLAKVPESRPQSMTAIRDWIQSEGKAKGAIPKASTKTMKMRTPMAVADQPEGDVQQDGSRRWRINALGALIIIMSFVIGILLSRGGKKDEPTPPSDSNGSAVVVTNGSELIVIRGEDIIGEEFGSSGEGAYRINSNGTINASSNSYGAPQILVFGPEVSKGEITADIQAGGGPYWHVGIAMLCAKAEGQSGGQQYYNSSCIALIYAPGKVVLANKLMMGHQSADIIKSLDQSDSISPIQLGIKIRSQETGRMLTIHVNGQELRQVNIDPSQGTTSGQFVLYMANAGGSFTNVEARYYK